jgi:hypothetical protein
MASSEEIRMSFPAAFSIMFTSGLDLVDSQKDTTRHIVQNDVDLAKVWWVLSILR